MPATLLHKRSATAGDIPTTSQLQLGELGVNTYDGKVYTKKNVGGTESIVEVGGGGSGLVANDCIQEMGQTISANYTITSGKNALSAGPITIADGVTVTVPDGSTWTVV